MEVSDRSSLSIFTSNFTSDFIFDDNANKMVQDADDEGNGVDGGKSLFVLINLYILISLQTPKLMSYHQTKTIEEPYKFWEDQKKLSPLTTRMIGMIMEVIIKIQIISLDTDDFQDPNPNLNMNPPDASKS